jgi:hypothetical protein
VICHAGKIVTWGVDKDSGPLVIFSHAKTHDPGDILLFVLLRGFAASRANFQGARLPEGPYFPGNSVSVAQQEQQEIVP